MKSDVSRQQFILQERLQKRLAQSQAQVMVRDIIVVGVGDGADGEFLYSKYHHEAESAIIGRMLAEIKALLQGVEVIHLEDNYHISDGKLIMREDKQNAITRMTTNEFYFYPEKRQGPISERGFKHLLREIDKMAGNSLENLHLILASFPVMNTKREVHNMVVHVQCGVSPRLTAFAKLTASENDIEYEATKIPYFMAAYKVNHRIEKMNSLLSRIEKRQERYPGNLSIGDIKQLRLLVSLSGLEGSSTTLNLIDQLLDRSGDFGQLIKELGAKVDGLTREIQRQADSGRGLALMSLKNNRSISSAKVSASNQPELPINYNGVIDCATVGRAIFTTAMDICLDHAYDISRRMHSINMKQQASGGLNFIPTQISQVVTSNTIAIDPKSVFAGDVMHADPKYVEIMTGRGNDQWDALYPVMHERWTSQSFGLTSKIAIFPVRQLMRVGLEFAKQLEIVNAHLLKIRVLSLLSCRGQSQAELIQPIKDIKLRLAFELGDLEQIQALIRDGADVLYQDEAGVSTLSLVSTSTELYLWFDKGDDLPHLFSLAMSSGDHKRAVALYEEAKRYHLTRRLKPLLSFDLDLGLKVDLFYAAVRQRDEWLMQYLINSGLNPVYVDPNRGRALYNEILKLTQGRDGLMAKLRDNFLSCTNEDVLLQSLKDVDDVDQAMGLMFASAIHDENEHFFSSLLQLGGDCLGVNPVTGSTLLIDIPVRGSKDIAHAMYSEVIKSHRVNHFMAIVIENRISSLKITFFIKYIAGLNEGKGKVLGEVVDALIKADQYRYLESVMKDPLIYPLMPEFLQDKISSAIEGFNAFKAALYHGNVVAVASAFDAGMSVNVKLGEGQSPLMVAIVTGQIKLVDLILGYRPDVTLTNAEGETVLALAIALKKWEPISLLYDYCVNEGVLAQVFDAISMCAIKNSLKTVMLSQVLKVDKPGACLAELDTSLAFAKKLGLKLGLSSGFGVKMMLAAIKQNDPMTAAWLLDHGVDVNAVDKSYVSLLATAISAHANGIALLLISRGASLVEGESGQHLLVNRALISDNATILDQLLDLSHDVIDLNVIQPNMTLPPLHYALSKGCEAVIPILIKHGADVNAVDYKLQRSPLMLSIRQQSLSMMQALLAAGANPNLEAGRWTPLTYAVKRSSDPEFLRPLLSAPGININQQCGRWKQSALHMAVKRNKPALIDLLLSHGADMDITNRRGETPMAMAERCGHAHLVERFKLAQSAAMRSQRP